MIKTINQDMFKVDADVLVHQVNCQGVMGSGVAYQVKQLYPEAFKRYNNLCSNARDYERHKLLGEAQVVSVEEKYIVNLFAQEKYGYDGAVYTDYDALRASIIDMKRKLPNSTLKIAIPYHMGCCRGGGDWSVVSKIIEDELSDYEVMICKI